MCFHLKPIAGLLSQCPCFSRTPLFLCSSFLPSGDFGNLLIHVVENAKRGIDLFNHAPIAQLDRVTDYESVGRRFESCWARQKITG